METFINIIHGIGTLIRNTITLIIMCTMFVFGLIFIVSFWGSIAFRPITFADLTNSYIGLGLWFLVLCMAVSYLTDDKAEESEGVEIMTKEFNCTTCGKVLLDEKDIRSNESKEVFCSDCWGFWAERKTYTLAKLAERV